MSKKRNRVYPDGTIEGTCKVINENLDAEEEKGEEEMNNQNPTQDQNKQNPKPTECEDDKKEWFGPRLWKKTPTAVKIGIGALGVGVLGFLAGCFFSGSDNSSEAPVLPDPDDDYEDDEDSYKDEDNYEEFLSAVNNITDNDTQDTPSTETSVEG